jgi:HD superfamily phosphohydrolase
MSDNWNDRKRPAYVVNTEAKKPKTDGFALKKLGTATRSFTRYNDEVHKTIDICPVMNALMDTKQFQRLRNIKQLGTSYLVYANANHTRFEHSVGVAHLARGMCSRLQKKHPQLGTTDKDVLCVAIAGLLHDIGHGPFSHLYEEFRGAVDDEIKKNPSMRQNYESFPPVPETWSHERSSLFMIDAALATLGLAIDMSEKNLDKPLTQIGDGVDAMSMRCFWSQSDNDDSDILTNRDWIFIKECIYGKPIPEVREKLGIDALIGRQDPKKEWLYDIVSNRHNGIDVDKVDYFARDERRTMAEAGNVNVSIIYEACIAKASCAKIDCKQCKNGGLHYMICYPKKCQNRIIEFFRFRGRMHEFVYQHKTTTASGCMLVDILKKADLHYLIPAGEEWLPISRALLNQEAFYRLKDSIIESIVESTSEELKPARALAERFLARDLYSKFQPLCQLSNQGMIATALLTPVPYHSFLVSQRSAVKKWYTWMFGKKKNYGRRPSKDPRIWLRIFVMFSGSTQTKRATMCI